MYVNNICKKRFINWCSFIQHVVKITIISLTYNEQTDKYISCFSTSVMDCRIQVFKLGLGRTVSASFSSLRRLPNKAKLPCAKAHPRFAISDLKYWYGVTHGLSVEDNLTVYVGTVSLMAEIHHIDVICLQETHVNDDKSDRLTISGFDIIS